MHDIAAKSTLSPNSSLIRERDFISRSDEPLKPPAGKASRIYSTLDAWRGLAALAVIYFHASEKVIDRDPSQSHSLIYAPGMFGYLGVQVFFVISGFCIANAVCATLSLKRTTGSYLLARVRRIFPPMWISLFFYAIFSIGGMLLLKHGTIGANFARVMPVDLRKVGPAFWLANLTLTQPWLHQDYLSMVCWTLCYEISFYAIMAILLNVRVFCGGVRSLLNLAHITTGVTLVALIIHPAWVPFPLDMWPQFGLGVLVYDLLTHRREKAVTIATIMLVSLTLMFISMQSSEVGLPGLRQPSRLTYSVGLVFAALLLGLRAYDAALAKLLPVRALMQTGRASYSIYLTHTLCLTMLHLTMKVAHIEDAVFLRFAASFVASIVFGFVFFQFAERPFLSAPKPVKKEPAASDPVTASRFAPAP